MGHSNLATLRNMPKRAGYEFDDSFPPEFPGLHRILAAFWGYYYLSLTLGQFVLWQLWFVPEFDVKFSWLV